MFQVHNIRDIHGSIIYPFISIVVSLEQSPRLHIPDTNCTTKKTTCADFSTGTDQDITMNRKVEGTTEIQFLIFIQMNICQGISRAGIPRANSPFIHHFITSTTVPDMYTVIIRACNNVIVSKGNIVYSPIHSYAFYQSYIV